LTKISSKQLGETRKLQMTGGSTYILSIPKRWIIQNQLKKGSALLIREEEDGSLSILSPELRRMDKMEEVFIKVSPNEESNAVIRKVVSAYLVGYNVITVMAEKNQNLSLKQRNAIKNFARHLLVGTEIVTDAPAEVTLQVLLSYPELSVQSALRRMCVITSSMHKDVITALKELNQQLAKSVITTDNEVDRFNLYIIRQLKTAIQNSRIIKEIGLSNARDCLGYRLVTKSVERTADHATSIAENVLPLKKPLNAATFKRIEKMSSIAVSMFENSIESLFKQDFNLAESLIEKAKEVASLEKEALASFQKIESEGIANLRLIIESIRRTAEYATDIAEIVLNLTIDSIIEQ